MSNTTGFSSVSPSQGSFLLHLPSSFISNSILSWDFHFHLWISTILLGSYEHVINIYKQINEWAISKFQEVNAIVILTPYRLLSQDEQTSCITVSAIASTHTSTSAVYTLSSLYQQLSWIMKISSSKSPCGTTVLISSCSNSQSNCATMDNKPQMEVCFTTGENTS